MINCTVGILTRNVEATLPRCLESVRDFAEIIICDGHSADKTLSIAHDAGARVLFQDERFLNNIGRIRDFSGVRNQMLEAASYDWFAFVDADEYFPETLTAEIRAIVASNIPAAFWVPRKYSLNGTVIDCSIGYPNKQMRLFHRSAANLFIKEVHERIELRPGIIPETMSHYMVVPIEDSPADMYRKNRYYLDIESTRRYRLSFRQWCIQSLRSLARIIRYGWRLLLIRATCRGTRLPIAYEMPRIWYQWNALTDSLSDIDRL